MYTYIYIHVHLYINMENNKNILYIYMYILTLLHFGYICWAKDRPDPADPIKWRKSRCSQAPFTRAKGKDDVSLEQTPPKKGQ